MAEELVSSAPAAARSSQLTPQARLARNSVTMGDYERPLLINQFAKDLLAGFQMLNLKNDSLRRRSDGLKYRVRRASLRGAR